MNVQTIQKKITPLLEEYGISYAALFGSVARGQDQKDSDVDLLVRLGRPMGMVKYMRFVNGLEASLNKKVDVVTEKSLNKYIRPHILSDLKVIYEK